MDARDQDMSQPSPPAPPSPPPNLESLVLAEGYEIGDGAHVGPDFNLDMRNPDFPRTYIESIHLDLASPKHWIQITWTGPLASLGPVGPWHACPGRGINGNDCNDVAASNAMDSCCTPKGVFPVAGFADHLTGVPDCHYVTWVLYAPRFIGLHSHWDIPSQPTSHGCIRVPYDVAHLIHNNSRVGLTLINIEGHWTRPVRQYEQDDD